MAGKRETIHIDLTSLTNVGPMGVPGMTSVSKDSKKVSKGKGKPSRIPDRPRRPAGQEGLRPVGNLNINNVIVDVCEK